MAEDQREFSASGELEVGDPGSVTVCQCTGAPRGRHRVSGRTSLRVFSGPSPLGGALDSETAVVFVEVGQGRRVPGPSGVVPYRVVLRDARKRSERGRLPEPESRWTPVVLFTSRPQGGDVYHHVVLAGDVTPLAEGDGVSVGVRRHRESGRPPRLLDPGFDPEVEVAAYAFVRADCVWREEGGGDVQIDGLDLCSSLLTVGASNGERLGVRLGYLAPRTATRSDDPRVADLLEIVGNADVRRALGRRPGAQEHLDALDRASTPGERAACVRALRDHLRVSRRPSDPETGSEPGANQTRRRRQ